MSGSFILRVFFVGELGRWAVVDTVFRVVAFLEVVLGGDVFCWV
jgi:hypothetical protein